MQLFCRCTFVTLDFLCYVHPCTRGAPLFPLSDWFRPTALLCLFSAFVSPLFAGTPNQPGVFYVSEYAASGTHTDYDMARQAADAYAAELSWSVGSVLVLKAGVNYTCDAAPLPSLGNVSTTSLIGSGSGLSSLVKSPGCASSAATLSHLDSPNGALSRGWYQGFTVDANHIDAAACGMYGMSLTSFVDVACGNAVAGADHELEFGNRDANSVGWMDNIYIYSLKTFDSVAGGKGAVLAPVWSGGELTGVTLVNGGTEPYTPQYTRMQVFGPDLPTCSTVPTLTPTFGANSRISGAVITTHGACASTAHLAILIQDGTPVTYGMKFSNMADSQVWGLEALGSTTYGEGWLMGSNNNTIANEKPGPNQLFGMTDNANGNRHLNPVFVSPGGYAAGIYSQNGTIQSPMLTWDSSSAYPAASGYYFGNDHRVYQDWMVQDSTCGSSPSSSYLSAVTEKGVLSNSNVLPAGAKLQNLAECNGTNTTNWTVTEP